MNIGFIHDYHPDMRPSGAGYQIQDLIQASPDDITCEWLLPGNRDDLSGFDGLVIAALGMATPAEIEGLVIGNDLPKIRMLSGYDGGANREAVRAVHDHCSAVIYRSPMHRDYYQRMYGSEGEWIVIPPPVDSAEIRMAVQGIDQIRSAMWCGEWIPYKGHDLARRLAMTEGLFLDFYGIGTLPQEPIKSASFNGQLPRREDVWRTMASHQAFIHSPRYADPFSVPVIEAYAAGCELLLAGRIGVRSFDMEIPEVAEMCQLAGGTFWDYLQGVIS